MKFSTLSAIAAATVLTPLSLPAQATILTVAGSGQQIAPPAEISNSGSPKNALHILGFDEKQGVTLTKDITVDTFNGNSLISSGTVVNSHLIFLNQPNHQTGTVRKQASWTFDGVILGVMSDFYGTFEAASNDQLAAAATRYPASFKARGLESADHHKDTYSGIGTQTLDVNFQVTQPGDWIRVVTAAPTSVPEPASAMALVGIGASLFLKRRQRHA